MSLGLFDMIAQMFTHTQDVFVICHVTVTQVLYTGKSTALGIKQGGPAAGKWAELPITKSPKVVQVAVGHDGQHVLLVSEDGSVFFAGTPRRGEDADGSVGEWWGLCGMSLSCCLGWVNE